MLQTLAGGEKPNPDEVRLKRHRGRFQQHLGKWHEYKDLKIATWEFRSSASPGHQASRLRLDISRV